MTYVQYLNTLPDVPGTSVNLSNPITSFDDALEAKYAERAALEDVPDDLDANGKTRKQRKIEASEKLAEARADQIYIDQIGYTKLNFNMSGKQGQFDRIYQKPDGSLVFVECKGGNSTLGTRVDSANKVNQQGTKAYMDDIVQNMYNKLPNGSSLKNKLEEFLGQEIDVEYHLVKQGAASITNPNHLKVKKFNIN